MMQYTSVNKKGIFKNLYPDYIYKNVEDIPHRLIKENDIKLILFDMDNTLVNHKYVYTNELKEWIRYIKNEGVMLYIFSNSRVSSAVKKIASELGMNYKYKVAKPRLSGYKKIIEETNIKKENIMMIGDQIFTDIWGGNRFGIKTILVSPINKQEGIITKVKRPIEKLFLNKIKKGEKYDD